MTQSDPNTPQPPEPAPTTPWLTRAILVISLALNLAVIGVVLGFLAMADRPGPEGGRDGGRGAPGGVERTLGLGPYAGALPGEDRQALIDSIAPRREALKARRSALRQSFEHTLEILRAEDFDRAAMAAQMQQQRAAISENAEIGQEALLDYLATLSPEARASFADRLERRLGREPGARRGERGERGPDGPPPGPGQGEGTPPPPPPETRP